MSHPIDTDTSLRRWLFQFRDVIAALVLLIAVEALVFHSGFYHSLLKPGSYAGKRHSVDLTAQFQFDKNPDSSWVIFFGNSIVGQGIDLRAINQELKGTALGVKLAQGGLTPRGFYHLLRRQDFAARNIRAVVVGVPFSAFRSAGNVETSWSTDKNDHADLAALSLTYGPTDQPRLAASFKGWEKKLHALSGSIFKSPLLRPDLRDLLASPRERFLDLARHPTNPVLLPAPRAAPGKPAHRTLHGLRLDENGELDISEASEWFRRPDTLKTLRRQVVASLKLQARDPLGGAPLRPVYHPILRRYLMDTARLAWRRGTPTVWAAMPSTPFPISETVDLSALEAMAKTLRAEGVDVRVFNPSAMIRRLQQPQYFKDTQHLNAEGAMLISRAVGRDLLRDFKSRNQAGAVARSRPMSDSPSRHPHR